jgi:hypothetical protein
VQEATLAIDVEGRIRTYEIESFLHEVIEKGFCVIHISKLWRLLGKGSRASGTWKALLDIWEELGSGYERSDLYMFETNHQYIVISRHQNESVLKKANGT